MTHPTPGGFRGLLYVVRSFVPRQCWPRSGQHGFAGRTARPRTTAHDRPRTITHDHEWPTTHARPTTYDHERPTLHDHARPRMTDRARPRTTDHARQRTTTHDQAWPTTHDRARPTTAAIFVWGSGTHPTPGGFRGLNCLARLALARERTPSSTITNTWCGSYLWQRMMSTRAACQSPLARRAS